MYVCMYDNDRLTPQSGTSPWRFEQFVQKHSTLTTFMREDRIPPTLDATLSLSVSDWAYQTTPATAVTGDAENRALPLKPCEPRSW